MQYIVEFEDEGVVKSGPFLEICVDITGANVEKLREVWSESRNILHKRAVIRLFVA